MSKLLLLLSCVAPLLAQTTQSDVAPAQSETAPAQSDHSGPSVLSRGIGSGMFSSTLGYFRPHVGLNGVYNSQLTGAALDPSGRIVHSGSEGIELSYGVSGSHKWVPEKGPVFFMGGNMIDDLTGYGGFGRRRYYQATVGFTYSLGDLPLTLW